MANALFERQTEPVGQAGEETQNGPETAFDVEVRSARAGHRGRQLGLAQDAGHDQQRCQQIGDDHRRSGLGIGNRRQDEQPRTDHRAGRNGKHIQRPQLFPQSCHAQPSLLLFLLLTIQRSVPTYATRTSAVPGQHLLPRELDARHYSDRQISRNEFPPPRAGRTRFMLCRQTLAGISPRAIGRGEACLALTTHDSSHPTRHVDRILYVYQSPALDSSSTVTSIGPHAGNPNRSIASVL